MGSHHKDQLSKNLGLKKNSTILVTGGSGFVGRNLISRLSTSGHTVVCMYHQRLPEPMANVYPICSDMSSSELLATPLRGVDTVVHLAWENNIVGPGEPMSGNIAALKNKSRNIQILNNLIQAMDKANTKRLIFLSTIGASRKAVSAFLQEKYLAEFFVLNSSIPERIILKSSVICSTGQSNDRFLNSIKRVMKYPAFYPVPLAKTSIAPIHVDQISEILAKAISHELGEMKSAVLEVSGQDNFKVEELFRLVHQQLGNGTKIPLKGFIGQTLLPIFEREKSGSRDARNPKSNQSSPSLMDYMAIVASKTDSDTSKDNPILDIGKTEVISNVRASLALAKSV